MSRMGCISRPGVKHNPYATVTVNRTVIAENGGLFPQNYGLMPLYDANAKFGYYTDDFTLTLTARANGEDLYYEITGAGAETARFYQTTTGRSGTQTNWYTNPDGSTSTTDSLRGRIGRLSSATWTKAAYANTTSSNTNDTATSTTFSVNIRTRNATTGTILATSSTITCYKFRFVIDIYNETAGVYQNASFTIPGERNPSAPAAGRNYYCRLLLPTNTVYNNNNLFSSFNSYGVIALVASSSGTSITVGSDLTYYMTGNGWWDAYGGNYLWFAAGVSQDGVTEAIEYFRFKLNWQAYHGLVGDGWTYSQNHAIAANTT